MAFELKANDAIDRLKRLYGLKTDREVCDLLGMKQALLVYYRTKAPDGWSFVSACAESPKVGPDKIMSLIFDRPDEYNKQGKTIEEQKRRIEFLEYALKEFKDAMRPEKKK